MSNADKTTIETTAEAVARARERFMEARGQLAILIGARLVADQEIADELIAEAEEMGAGPTVARLASEPGRYAPRARLDGLDWDELGRRLEAVNAATEHLDRVTARHEAQLAVAAPERLRMFHLLGRPVLVDPATGRMRHADEGADAAGLAVMTVEPCNDPPASWREASQAAEDDSEEHEAAP